MIRYRKVVFWLCVLLSFTGISFFKIGLANFTPFHAFAVIAILMKVGVAFKTGKVNWIQPVDFVLAFLYLVTVNLCHLDDIKLSSFFYSIIILAEFLLLYNLVREMSLRAIKHVAKTIIILYFANIAVASIFILLRIYPGEFLLKVFQIYYFDNRVRPYGFSDEPSYASIILVFAFYVFLKCDNFVYKRTELKWYLTVLIAVFLTDSSYGYVLLALLLLYFVLKNRGVTQVVNVLAKSKLFSRWEYPAAMVILLICLIMGIKSMHLENNRSLKRLAEIYKSITTSDDEFTGTIKNIAYFDGSASMRVVPTIMLFDNYSKISYSEIFFGKGAGQATPFFSKQYQGNTTLLGFIPSFIYNYGLVGAFLFLWIFFGIFPKEKLMLGILFVLFIFNADFNTQIFLFVLFCIMASAQVERLQDKQQLAEL